MPTWNGGSPSSSGSRPTPMDDARNDLQGTVFVVDDDDAIRSGLSMLLESYGYRPRTFHSGEEFLACCSKSLPDRCMAILDLSMPGMDGLEIQAEMRKKGIEVPVVFLSGEGDIPAAVSAVQHGAVDFIEKPVNSDLLVDRIEKAFELQEQKRTSNKEDELVQSRLASLTPREREILELIAGGQISKSIAIDLGISERTVELHRSRILKKMRVRNSTELLNQVLPSLRPR